MAYLVLPSEVRGEFEFRDKGTVDTLYTGDAFTLAHVKGHHVLSKLARIHHLSIEAIKGEGLCYGLLPLFAPPVGIGPGLEGTKLLVFSRKNHIVDLHLYKAIDFLSNKSSQVCPLENDAPHQHVFSWELLRHLYLPLNCGELNTCHAFEIVSMSSKWVIVRVIVEAQGGARIRQVFIGYVRQLEGLWVNGCQGHTHDSREGMVLYCAELEVPRS
jgi:hypothetical protein